MHPTEVLQRLIQMQKNDGALDALARERQVSVDALDLHQAKVKAVEEQVALEKKNQEQLAKARKALEIEVGAKETQISKYQNQLFEVKSNEQYQALQHEIDHLRGKLIFDYANFFEKLRLKAKLKQIRTGPQAA
jgi:predicted  nucleic acid-binding Zn-ribbon protein